MHVRVERFISDRDLSFHFRRDSLETILVCLGRPCAVEIWEAAEPRRDTNPETSFKVLKTMIFKDRFMDENIGKTFRKICVFCP